MRERKTDRQRRPYTAAEYAVLRREIAAGTPHRLIAKKLRRHPGSISATCKRLDIRPDSLAAIEAPITLYRVRWEVEVEATCPQEAALRARYYQTKRDTTATVFDVYTPSGAGTRVDVSPTSGEG